MLLKLVDKREEEEALQTIEIEVLRRPIRCEENYELVIPERLKQALEYHRVGNVKHLELVYTKNADVPAESVTHSANRVLLSHIL